MAWNERSDRKPFYMREEQSGFVRPGVPVYDYDKSLVVRRYIPAVSIADAMSDYVEAHGGASFFQREEWKRELIRHYEEVLPQYAADCRYESDGERRQRTRDELLRSKMLLEQGLGKSVDFICWPGGGYDQVVLDEARAAGYKAWTLGSSDNSGFRNVPGADNVQVKRIGSSIQQHWRGRPIGYTTGWEFYCGVRRHQGSVLHKWAGRAGKAVKIMQAKI